MVGSDSVHVGQRQVKVLVTNNWKGIKNEAESHHSHKLLSAALNIL